MTKNIPRTHACAGGNKTNKTNIQAAIHIEVLRFYQYAFSTH